MNEAFDVFPVDWSTAQSVLRQMPWWADNPEVTRAGRWYHMFDAVVKGEVPAPTESEVNLLRNLNRQFQQKGERTSNLIGSSDPERPLYVNCGSDAFVFTYASVQSDALCASVQFKLDPRTKRGFRIRIRMKDYDTVGRILATVIAMDGYDAKVEEHDTGVPQPIWMAMVRTMTERGRKEVKWP